MLIANPIYDVFFKYLMEDTEIARQLLSKIIGENIIKIDFRPREVTSPHDKLQLSVLRMDFKAVILTSEGIKKEVLIEMQKSKRKNDIVRFRQYLGTAYAQKIQEKHVGYTVEESFPIITIYFLGYKLKNVKTPVAKVARSCVDLITNQPFKAQEPFINLLTHESFIIQIPRLVEPERTEIETVLRIFNQTHIYHQDEKFLRFDGDESDATNPLLGKMLKRLRRAVSDESLIEYLNEAVFYEMDMEDITQRNLDLAIQVAETHDKLVEKEQEITENKKTLADQDKALADQNKIISDREKALTDQAKIIEGLKRQLGNSADNNPKD